MSSCLHIFLSSFLTSSDIDKTSYMLNDSFFQFLITFEPKIQICINCLKNLIFDELDLVTHFFVSFEAP